MSLIGAGLNHARILIEHGLFWDYHGAHPASALYWSSLTVIDPLVAVLLLIRPRVGVPVTVALIASNVIHNLALTAWHVPASTFLDHVLSNWQLMSQFVFMTFVLATWRVANRGVR